MKEIQKAVFVYIGLILIDENITKPIIEYVTGSPMTFMDLLWWADVCFLVPISYALFHLFDIISSKIWNR